MFGLLAGRRRWFLPVVIFFVVIYYLLPDGTYVPQRFRGRHEIIAHEFPHISSSPKDKNGFLALPIADPYCKAHNFEAYQPRVSRRKVYDLFMVNTELDWLEIRLNELKDHVDYFVVLESKHTFTGKDKELHVKKNWKRFANFHDKIILRVVDDTALQSSRSRDHENLQRNALFDQVLSPVLSDAYPALTAAQTPSEDDVIIVSDIDEIPKPSTLTILRNCAFPIRLTLRSAYYYYSFQFLHRGTQWAHPQATVYRGNATIRPSDLRNGEGSYGGRNAVTLEWDKADLWNSSWHCSTCFSTIEETITRMNSISQQELNRPEYHERDYILDHVRKGQDLFNRAGELSDKIEGRNWDIPQFLVKTTEQSPKGWSWLDPTTYVSAIKPFKPKLVGGEALKGGRFEFLLNRDPPNANFQDYSMVDAMSGVHEEGNAMDRKPLEKGHEVKPEEKVTQGVPGGEAHGPEVVEIPGSDSPATGIPPSGEGKRNES